MKKIIIATFNTGSVLRDSEENSSLMNDGEKLSVMKEDIEKYIGLYVGVTVPNYHKNMPNFVHYGNLKSVSDKALTLQGHMIISLDEVKQFKVIKN